MESSNAAGAENILKAAMGPETGQPLDGDQTLNQPADADRLDGIRGPPLFAALFCCWYTPNAHVIPTSTWLPTRHAELR